MKGCCVIKVKDFLSQSKGSKAGTGTSDLEDGAGVNDPNRGYEAGSECCALSNNHTDINDEAEYQESSSSEMPWKQVQSIFSEYLQARDEFSSENGSGTPDGNDENACDHDPRLLPYRTKAESAWSSINFHCKRPAIDIDLVRGAMTFSHKPTLYDFTCRSWEYERFKEREEVEVQTSERYWRLSGTPKIMMTYPGHIDGELKSKLNSKRMELQATYHSQDMLIRKFREENGR
ncbi:hypothetical protein I204_07635 [Kwoniella mangroviensis CBS 8886]|nr:hypothetical protein I204_07635 [Kwoniella mangroviensis CBS 8886]